MKMKNGMYLFATAIVASTMGLASCSNDEEAVGVATPPQVAATKITLGVYANGMPEPHKRSTAEEVNMGSQTQAINQVAVVPVANGAYQAPIVFQGISAGEKQTEVKTVSLLETVDEFLVYGNIDAGKIKETADAFDGFTLSPAELSGGKMVMFQLRMSRNLMACIIIRMPNDSLRALIHLLMHRTSFGQNLQVGEQKKNKKSKVRQA